MSNVAYMMDFKAGKLVPIKTDGLKVGQVVSYGDMRNDRKKFIVVSSGPDERFSHGQKCVAVDGSHYTEVSISSIEGPGGWHAEKDDPWTAEQIADLCAKTDKIIALERENRELKAAQIARTHAAAKTKGTGKVPAWATHIIVANRVKDESDLMTDYFAHSTQESIILAFSKHGKDNFAEMRKAAATFEPTKHLGPNCDEYTARVVFSVDVPFDKCHNGSYSKGSYSHWHHELDGLDGRKFSTKAEAEAFVASQPKPDDLGFEGFIATFEWEIGFRSVEHREKYSMGHGYYLKKGWRDSNGWEVNKRSIGNETETMIGLGKVGPALFKGVK